MQDRLAVTVLLLLALAAAWVVLADQVLGNGSSTALWSDALAGALLGAAVIIRLLVPRPAVLSMGTAWAAGVWLVAAPLVLGYTDDSANWPAVWHDVTLGFAVMIVATIGALAAREPG
ncbi:hypothetical protein GCM10009539_02440 [Cryptosporangium japonicum]|uniref:SPW repeat-containing integral membrane domain-containing protein n=1 Tax=Cryptosporangium japonicum TaxID=80872 RepID=A0ABP3D195_9ACTN